MITTTRPSLLLTALQIARTQIGVSESPLGSNRGPQVDEYLRCVGLNPVGQHYSWCMAFVYWCYQQATVSLGIPNPLIRTAGCMDHWKKAYKPLIPHRISAAEARANPLLIKAGMIAILLFDTKTGAGHTYLVDSVNVQTGAIESIEGNADPAGGNNGVEVLDLRKRNLRDTRLVGFLDYSGAQTA